MAERENEIIDTNTQIVWVLAEASGFGSADNNAAQNFYSDTANSNVGIRVGDASTMPNPAFDSSPFRGSRGFWMIVDKSNMSIVHQATLPTYPSVDVILDTINGL